MSIGNKFTHHSSMSIHKTKNLDNKETVQKKKS